MIYKNERLQKKYKKKNLLQTAKPKLIPVRGKNGSLLVSSISFSSSTEINKFC